MFKVDFINYFEEAIKKHWDLPAFSDVEGEPIDYKTVASKIYWLHNLLAEFGVKRGDKVALLGKNSTNWAITYLSIITYGAVVVPILPNFTSEDMSHIIKHSESKLLFIGNSIMDSIEESEIPTLEGIIHLDNFTLVNTIINAELKKKINLALAKKYDVSKDKFMLPKGITNNTLGEIVYTSGTTGFTKGVMLPLNSLIVNIVFAQETLAFRTGSQMLSFLPLSHAYACAFDFLYPFSCGVHVHFLGKIPSPKLLLKHLKEISPEIILSVPLILEKIIKKNIFPLLEKKSIKVITAIPGVKQAFYSKVKKQLLSVFGGSLQEMIIGGAPLNAEVEKFLKEIKFPFTVGYGMSECGPLISYAAWNKHKYRSSGQIVNYLQAKVDSPDPATIPGDIWVKGEQVTTGYYKNPEATKEVFKADGWFNTGDIGLIDQENFIFIKGRSKNLILGSGGENIYPEAVEQTFNNLPYVQESLVVERSNKLVILVYPDVEEADKEGISQTMYPKLMEQNKNIYNETAPAYAKIAEVKIVPEPFLKTPTQKIKRYMYK
ncbi:MAG: AMP-binding protein [Candidatus Cloacimonadales bacterium]